MSKTEIGYIIIIAIETFLMVLLAFLAFKKNNSFLSDLYNSFKNNPEGFSAKKLTAFATMCLLIHLHYRVSDQVMLLRVIALDQLFILLLFGIIFFKDVIGLVKSIKGAPDSPPTCSPTETPKP